MDVFEALYKRISTYYRKKKEAQLLDGPAVQLKDLEPRFVLIARALCGAPIHIAPAEREGGWKDDTFYLPEHVTFFSEEDQNISFYLFRIFYLYTQRNLDHRWKELLEDQNLALSQKTALEHAPEVLEAIAEESPKIIQLHDQLKENLEAHCSLQEIPVDYSWLYGKWMYGTGAQANQTLKHVADESFKTDTVDAQTEIEARPIEQITTVTVDKEKQEEYVLMHNFEKVETAEEFNDIWRDFDGEDSLADDQEALRDLNLRHTVRVDDMVHSVYKAEFSANLTIAESKTLEKEGFHYSYPEWDFAKKKYKPDYCKVFPLLYQSRDNSYGLQTLQDNKHTILNLRKLLQQVNNEQEKIRRTPQGEDFDFDAVVDLYSDIHAGVTPSEKIYFSNRK